MNDEFRAMTKNQRTRERAVMISSTIPSAKYSCSGSPLMLVKGKTATDGLSGRGGAERYSRHLCPQELLADYRPSPASRCS